MDRRDFFKRGMGKVTETAIKHADEKLALRAQQWIRPPFALSELEFLLACTRCMACIEACPHRVIFPLAARLGPDVAGTPALDLLNRACHLCHDWPCVQSCEPKALFKADDELNAFPKLARANIDTASCLPYLGPECGACASSCPIPGALQWNRERPTINNDACAGCALCREACVLEPKAVLITVCKTSED